MTADRSWAAWILGTCASFAAMETRYYRSRSTPSTTLTATLRRWLGIAPRHPRRWLLAPAFAAFLTWFAGHILLGWKP